MAMIHKLRVLFGLRSSEEAGGDIDRAYDNYRIALRLDPSQPLARERVSTMEGAAGVKSDSDSP